MTAADQIKGRPVSGRVWKEQAQKASKRVAISTLKTGYAKRMKKLSELKIVKGIEKEMKDEKKNEKEARIQARKVQEEQRLANEKKNQIVQVISNSRKLKRLKKKQMKNIVKM
jgi:rRNA-processing protein CGR1